MKLQYHRHESGYKEQPAQPCGKSTYIFGDERQCRDHEKAGPGKRTPIAAFQ
jgi:hypothetical protein